MHVESTELSSTVGQERRKKGSNLGPVLKFFFWDGPVFCVTNIPVQPVDEQPQFSGLCHLVVATVLTAEKSKHQHKDTCL